MKTKLMTVLAATCLACSVQAATVSFNPAQPAVGSSDIAYLVGSPEDGGNIGGGNDHFTYVAQDRPAQGQTFKVPASVPGHYAITGVSVRHPGYDAGESWSQVLAGAEIGVRIVNPAVAGTNDFVISSESYTITGTEANSFASTNNARDAVGHWVTVSLDKPVLVTPGSEFGFDLVSMAGANTGYFEIMGDSAATYEDGSAYISGGSGVAGSDCTVAAGDRVFIVHLAPITTAYNPTPDDGEVDVPTDNPVLLSWNTAVDVSGAINSTVTGHKLYVGDSEPNMVLVSTIPVSGATGSYSLAVGRDATYVWRVDETTTMAEPNDIITGPTWSFKTDLSVPVLASGSPVSLKVLQGDPASFSVSATNPFTDDDTGMTYQWYHDSVIMEGQTSSILTIDPTQESDSGSYYCEVTITSNGKGINSGTAILSFKRMVAYLPMESTTQGSTVAGSPATTVVGTPTVVAGVSGSALNFNGSSGLRVGAVGDTYFDDLNTEMTVTCWFKSTIFNPWCAYVSRFGEGSTGWQLRWADSWATGGIANRATFTTRGHNNAGDSPFTNTQLNDGNWHFIVGTYDGTTKKIFVDGMLENQIASTGIIGTTTSPVGIGVRFNGTVAEGYVNGAIDDVRLYNYAISSTEIAALYYDVTGEEICLLQSPADLNNDCTVDLADFAILAESWMECNIYPTCVDTVE